MTMTNKQNVNNTPSPRCMFSMFNGKACTSSCCSSKLNQASPIYSTGTISPNTIVCPNPPPTDPSSNPRLHTCKKNFIPPFQNKDSVFTKKGPNSCEVVGNISRKRDYTLFNDFNTKCVLDNNGKPIRSTDTKTTNSEAIPSINCSIFSQNNRHHQVYSSLSALISQFNLKPNENYIIGFQEVPPLETIIKNTLLMEGYSISENTLPIKYNIPRRGSILLASPGLKDVISQLTIPPTPGLISSFLLKTNTFQIAILNVYAPPY